MARDEFRTGLFAVPSNKVARGQWLWLSWLSGHFRHQISAVRTPSSTKFYLQIYLSNCKIEKTKIKKEAEKGPPLKKQGSAGHTGGRKLFLNSVYGMSAVLSVYLFHV